METRSKAKSAEVVVVAAATATANTPTAEREALAALPAASGVEAGTRAPTAEARQHSVSDDRNAVDAMTQTLQRVCISYASESADASNARTPSASMPPSLEFETMLTFKHTIVMLVNKVYAALGNAQMEKTYQGALLFELRKLHTRGVCVEEEVSINIEYDGAVVGTRRVDLMVAFADGSRCILELKAVIKALSCDHLKQLKYYMWTFQVPHGILINFPHAQSFPDVESGWFELERLYGQTVLSNVQLRKRAVTSEPEVYCVTNAEIQAMSSLSS